MFDWLKNWLKWRQFQRWANVEWAKLEIKSRKMEIRSQRRRERMVHAARQLERKRENPQYIE